MPRRDLLKPERMLKPKEVAPLFGVDVKTIRRWAIAGILPSFRVGKGTHRRYRESEVRKLLKNPPAS